MSYDIYVGIRRPDNWNSLLTEEKFACVNLRMNNITHAITSHMWRKRYASKEQLTEEYPEDWQKILSVLFLDIKEDYESIRDWVLEHIQEGNSNVIAMEKLITEEIDDIILGDKNGK